MVQKDDETLIQSTGQSLGRNMMPMTHRSGGMLASKKHKAVPAKPSSVLALQIKNMDNGDQVKNS